MYYLFFCFYWTRARYTAIFEFARCSDLLPIRDPGVVSLALSRQYCRSFAHSR